MYISFLRCYFMSSYSIGKNEVKNLMEQERLINKKLEEVSSLSTGSVCSFQSILLKKEMERIHTRLTLLSYQDPLSDDDSIA